MKNIIVLITISLGLFYIPNLQAEDIENELLYLSDVNFKEINSPHGYEMTHGPHAL